MIEWIKSKNRTISSADIAGRQDIDIIYEIPHTTIESGINPDTNCWTPGPKYCLIIKVFTSASSKLFSIRQIIGLSYSEAMDYPNIHEKQIIEIIVKMINARY